MSISIDTTKCTGCGKCMSVCPGNLLEKNLEGRVAMPCPADCWGCAACIKMCSFGALSLYLTASLGGCGSNMTVKKKGSIMNWTVTTSEGTTQTISVNSHDANNY